MTIPHAQARRLRDIESWPPPGPSELCKPVAAHLPFSIVHLIEPRPAWSRTTCQLLRAPTAITSGRDRTDSNEVAAW